jgi:hypothetical protein
MVGPRDPTAVDRGARPRPGRGGARGPPGTMPRWREAVQAMIEASARIRTRTVTAPEELLGPPIERRHEAGADFPGESVARLHRAIQSFNWFPSVLPADEGLRADVARLFDFIVAQMACAEAEAGLVFGASPRTQRVEWKWWNAAVPGRDRAADRDAGGGKADGLDPLRRGEPHTVTLTVRHPTPQLIFALRQVIRLLPPGDVEVRPPIAEVGPPPPEGRGDGMPPAGRRAHARETA